MLLALAQGEHLVYAASPRLWALALLHFGRYNFFTSFLQFTKSMMLFTQDAVLLALENVILLQVQFTSVQQLPRGIGVLQICGAMFSFLVTDWGFSQQVVLRGAGAH